MIKDQRREFPALISGHSAKNTAAKIKNMGEIKDMIAGIFMLPRSREEAPRPTESGRANPGDSMPNQIEMRPGNPAWLSSRSTDFDENFLFLMRRFTTRNLGVSIRRLLIRRVYVPGT